MDKSGRSAKGEVMEINDRRDHLSVEDSDLRESSFHNVNLHGAIFENVNMADSKLIDANLNNVEVVDANIAGMKINGILVEAALAAFQRCPE